MFLVVGLGNPGSGYAGNRHNIGFMAADEIVRRHSFGPWRRKFQGHVAEGEIGGTKVLVLKPETFMNLSGQSVGEVLRFYKIPIEDVIVLHDELDLPPGKLRVKRAGGHGGHNGLRSIDAHCGKEYRRVRLGIGHPGDKARVHGHVLGDFSKSEQTGWLSALIDGVAQELPRLIKGDDSAFMSKVANLVTPPKPRVAKPAKIDKAEKVGKIDKADKAGSAGRNNGDAAMPVAPGAGAKDIPDVSGDNGDNGSAAAAYAVAKAAKGAKQENAPTTLAQALAKAFGRNK